MYDRDDVDEAQRSPGAFPNIDLLHRVYNEVRALITSGLRGGRGVRWQVFAAGPVGMLATSSSLSLLLTRARDVARCSQVTPPPNPVCTQGLDLEFVVEEFTP